MPACCGSSRMASSNSLIAASMSLRPAVALPSSTRARTLLTSLRNDLLGISLRLGELAGEQQRAAGVELRVGDVGQKFRGGHRGAHRLEDLAAAQVGGRQLPIGLAEARILLNRVAILDDRRVDVLVLDVAIAALDVLALGLLDITRARRGRE